MMGCCAIVLPWALIHFIIIAFVYYLRVCSLSYRATVFGHWNCSQKPVTRLKDHKHGGVRLCPPISVVVFCTIRFEINTTLVIIQ